MTAAAIISIVTLSLLAIFQFALACGAPLGRFAWGGQHKVLPTRLRIGSAVSIVIYAVFSIFALSKAGFVTFISSSTVVNIGLWIITAYLLFGVFLNSISRSKPERYVMTPVVAILAACFLVMTLM